MRAVCVDDEPLLAQMLAAMCRKLPELEEAESFTRGQDALDWLQEHPADIALLDIDMPDMNGLALARTIRELWPDIAIIFVTGYSNFAVDAFALHVSGYLLKPISQEQLAAEVSYALTGRERKRQAHIVVQTFGNFVVQVDGRSVAFNRSKAKELLAYLVDRQGGSVTRAQVFAALWEEGTYDRSMQKQLDVILRSLRSTLESYGIGEILELRSGYIRIRPELLDCDLYRFLKGDAEVINGYRGEYMSSYSWASMTEAFLTQNAKKT